MSVIQVCLGDLIEPANMRKAGSTDYPLLSMTMAGGLVDPATKFKKRVASEDTSGYKVVKRGQLVVGFPIDEGVLSFQQLHDEAIVSPAYGIWEIRSRASVDPVYLEKFLKSPQAIAYYLGKLRSTTARRRSLDRGSFLALPVPLPPLEEQKRIAGILDQAAELCRLRTRSLDKLSTLGQAIFHEMFGAAKPMLRAVGQLGDVQGGLQVTTKRDAYEFRAPYLRVANVYRDRLELCEIKTIGLTKAEAQRTTLNPGDVLIVEGHGNPAEIGRMAVWNGEITSCVHQNHLIRFRPDQSQILPQFFSSYMNSNIGRQHLTSSARTTSGLNTISTKKVKECVIPVPDLKSQRSFLSGYEAVRHQSSVFVRQLAKQEALFASLQHRAFRGEL